MQFLLVYIREAHALDSPWPIVGPDVEKVEDPLTLPERRATARLCAARLAIESLPTLVDTLDDATSRAYAAWPERLYLIDRDGRVVYHGGPGPFEYDTEELAQAIREELGHARGE